MPDLLKKSESEKVLLNKYAAEVVKVLEKKYNPIKTQVEMLKLQMKFFPKNGKEAVEILTQMQRAYEKALRLTPEEVKNSSPKPEKSGHGKK